MQLRNGKINFCLLFFILSIISGANSSELTATYKLKSQPVYLDIKKKNNHYDENIAPSCTLILSPPKVTGECYLLSRGDGVNELELLYTRFVNRVEFVSKNNRSEDRDQKEIYLEAFCTSEILNSCALESVINKSNKTLLPSSIMYAVSGYSQEIEELKDIYPVDYSPMNKKHFIEVINNRLLRVKRTNGVTDKGAE